MVSVDDLVISLRIDETGDLGKLQKQLTSLVGEKGEKDISLGAGVGFNVGRDIAEIKQDLLLLTSIAPGGRLEPEIRSAQANFRKLMDPTTFKNIIDKVPGIEIPDLEDIMATLHSISEKTSDMTLKQITGFNSRIDLLIRNSATEHQENKSLWTKIIKAIPEHIYQKQIQGIIDAVGGQTIREYRTFKTKEPEKVKKIVSEKDIALIDEIKKTNEERFNELKEIVKSIPEPFKRFRAAFPLLDITKISDITKINEISEVTREGVETTGLDVKEITKELKLYAAAMLETSRDQQFQMTKLFYEYIRDVMRKGKTVIGAPVGRKYADFVTNIWELIEKKFKGTGLEELLRGEIQGIKPGEDPEEYRKKTIGENVARNVELEKILNQKTVDELKPKIEVQEHTILLVKEFNKNKDEYIKQLKKHAKLYGHSIDVHKINIRVMQELLGLTKSIGDMKDEINKEAKRLKAEPLFKDFYKAIEAIKEKHGGEEKDDPRKALVARLKEIQATPGRGKELGEKGLIKSSPWDAIMGQKPLLFYQTLEAIRESIDGNGEDLELIMKAILNEDPDPINNNSPVEKEE